MSYIYVYTHKYVRRFISIYNPTYLIHIYINPIYSYLNNYLIEFLILTDNVSIYLHSESSLFRDLEGPRYYILT